MADDITESGGRPGGVSAADFLAALQRIQSRLDRIETHLDTQQEELRQALDRPNPSLVYNETVETREPDLLTESDRSSAREASGEPSPEPSTPPPPPTAIRSVEPDEPSLDILLADGVDDDDDTDDAGGGRRRWRVSGAGVAWIVIAVLIVIGGIYIATDQDRNQRLFGWLRGETDTISMVDSGAGTGTAPSPAVQQPPAQAGAEQPARDAGEMPTGTAGGSGTATGSDAPADTGGAPSASPQTPAASNERSPTPDQTQSDQPATRVDEEPQTPDQTLDQTPDQTPSDLPAGQPEQPPAEEIVVVEEQPLADEDLAPLPPGASEQLRLLAEAARRGDAPAQQDLGSRYAEGIGVEQSYELAYYWFGQAAEQGLVDAIYNLGVMNDRGLGTARDQEQAFRLFLRAAEAGHPRAQLATGLSYAQGNGVETNLTLATQWLQAASASGNPRGAFYMGRLFERGLDGAPDVAAAAGWYRIAADAGDADAALALDRLAGEDGDGSLASVTSPGERVPLPATEPTPVAAGSAEQVDRQGIREIQTLLGQLGFSPGSADGVMGNRTRGAIQAFQRLVGMPVTGEADTHLLARLRAAANES